MRKISLVSQVTRSFAAVLFTTLMQSLSAFAQTQDNTPPVPQSLSFAPTTIDVSGGDQTVTVTVRLTDDLSGFLNGCVYLRSPSALGINWNCFDGSNRTSGDDKDGIYQTTATFPQFSEAGTWHVSMMTRDRVGNEKQYSEEDLTAAGVQSTIEVASTLSDATAPLPQSLSFAPTMIDASGGDQTVTVTVRLTDDLSGFLNGCVYLRSPSALGINWNCFDGSNRTSGDDKDGIYQTTATFPQFSEAGTWHVSMMARDRVGNEKQYSEEDLTAAGVASTLDVSVSRPPVANAGPDQVVEATAPLTSVTLNGSASSDPDGYSLSFVWRDGTGNLVGTAAVVQVALPLGTQVFTLTVNDGHGSTASDSVAVTVRDTTAPTITVTRPNGGEKMLTGSGYTIQWAATDNVGVSSLSAFVSVDGGGSFTPITECTGLPSTASQCTWMAPGPATTQGRIRVTARDAAGNVGSDDSNANFTVVSGTASVTVTAPNTATTWRIGDSRNITFSHTLGIGQVVAIELSRDGGGTWEAINSAFTTTNATIGTFNWVVTGPITSAALVRVTWAGNRAINDVSNVSFNIIDRITVTSPNTEVIWAVGTSHPITFTHNLGVGEPVNIEVSRDGGSTWSAAGTFTTTSATSGSYPWLVTGPTTADARIRISRTANSSVADTSDVNFIIASPYVTVTSPNTGVSWRVGDTHNITFTHNLDVGASVNIEASRDGGATWSAVATFTTTAAASGSYPWVVSGPTTTQGRIRISWATDTSVNDTSNTNFTIASSFVTVTSPDTAVSWRIGDTRNITFTHNLGVGESVNIELSRDNGTTWSPITTFITTAATSGSYPWVVSGPVTTQGLVRVSWAADAGVADASNVNFTISNSFVTVTAPNTAVSWRIGDPHNITFTHNLGVGQSMNIELSRDGGATWSPITTFTTTSATSGSYAWTVSAPATAQGRVRVTWASDGAVTDIGDVNFIITQPIAITVPNTAVTWGIGSTRQITWAHSLGVTETVNIDVSRDGGTTWTAIAAGVPNATATTGTYTWIVSGPTSTQSRIRVSQTSDPTLNDLSSVNFTIANPSLNMTAPNTAVTWIVGTTQSINWNHNLGTAAFVNIDISRDGGLTWTSIATAVPNSGATTGTFSWLVAGPASSTSRVRVGWTDGPANDISNTNFTIR